jgi:hypothetical protein
MYVSLDMTVSLGVGSQRFKMSSIQALYCDQKATDEGYRDT